jgi:hypothetical protein
MPVRHTEINKDKALLYGPCNLEVEIYIKRLKKYKSLGSDKIPAESFQAGDEILVSVIYRIIN